MTSRLPRLRRLLAVASLAVPPLAFLCSPLALGADEASSDDVHSPVYTLGRITVIEVQAPRTEYNIGTATLERETMWDFSRDGLTDALNLIPGTATTPGTGQRNETQISIRGFDRWQVPLLMDGIRLYLPADNRIDFDRFLTPDLSELQVSKGYVSVLNGPDAMGGAINLVTRKPVKPFEAEVRASAALAEGGQYNGHTVYTHLGGRQQQWYYQASAQQRDLDHWRLSRDFSPTEAEDGGKRNHSGKKDWRVALKTGFTPNETDEYSINFTKQSGEKSGIHSTSGRGQPWEWPTWDTWSVYWLSHTQLGETGYVKTRLYYNKFDNSLLRYTDFSRNASLALSRYDDNARGGSIELGTDYLDDHTLKAALHYRRDEHTEWEHNYPQGFTEPKHSSLETTWSFALENTWRATERLELIAGISRDIRRSDKVEDYVGGPTGSLFRQPVADNFATNYQGALNYRYSDTGTVHFAVSNRTRFPNMFERFSSQFGGAVSNPWIDPERSLNIEIGVAETFGPGIQIETALFHNKVDDSIQPVTVVVNGQNFTQRQNVGEATFKGAEIAVSTFATATLEVGGNYTYIDTELKNPADPELRLTTTPRHKAFVYAKWQPFEALRLIPNVEYTSARWSFRDGPPAGYLMTDSFTLVNFRAEYRIAPGWELSLATRNLLDKNYQVVDGFPQEGRSFSVAVRYQF